MKLSSSLIAAAVMAQGASGFLPIQSSNKKSSSLNMVSSFDKTVFMPGLPPAHVLEEGGYKPQFANKLQLEEALTFVKTTLENNLKKNVNLVRVSCPMFVTKSSGFNDNLNGIERPATFAPRDFQDVNLEVPFSLAKWKRWALHYYEVPEGQGIVTDFRGLRCDDDIDYTHSLYVDQFDWEKHISPNDRNVEYLQKTVKAIYKAFYDTEQAVQAKYGIPAELPKEITFVTTDDLIQKYPTATPKERENIVCKEHGAVFLMGIGGLKPDGNLRHDGRAPDYDDWVTKRPDGGHGINGDIILWNSLLDQSFEVSSMGIRVNPETLLKQLDICDCPERKEFLWHSLLLDGTLPQTIGGGVGQSRSCQYFLRAAHIGEVQHGWYDPLEIDHMVQKGISLLGMGELEPDPVVAKNANLSP